MYQMDQMKKKIGVIAIILILILGVAFALLRLRKNKPTTHPKIGPIVESIYGLGTVQSENIFNLKLGVTAMVRKLFVSEGDQVQKGQRLLAFDQEGLQMQFAPFPATVSQINYFAGETVFPQSPVLTLVDLNHRYINVAIDQEGALRVRPKQKAFLSFESLEESSLVGSVKAIFPRQGQMIAYIEAPQLPKEVLPGMTADVAIVINEKEKALLLPLKFIHQGKINLKVGNRIESTPVKLGIVDAEWAEILSPPLTEDQLIEAPGE